MRWNAIIYLIFLPFLGLSQSNAIEALNDQLKQTPPSIIAQKAIANALTVENKGDSIFQLLLHEQVNFHDSIKGSIWHEYGKYHYNLMNDQKALDCFTQAVTLRQQSLAANAPKIAESLYAKVVCQQFLGKLDEAIVSLKTAEKIYLANDAQEDLINCQIRLGENYLQLEDYETAALYFQNALQKSQATANANAEQLGEIHLRPQADSNAASFSRRAPIQRRRVSNAT